MSATGDSQRYERHCECCNENQQVATSNPRPSRSGLHNCSSRNQFGDKHHNLGEKWPSTAITCKRSGDQAINLGKEGGHEDKLVGEKMAITSQFASEIDAGQAARLQVKSTLDRRRWRRGGKREDRLVQLLHRSP